MKKSKEQGQALIESMVAVTLIATAIFVLSSLSQFLWLKINLQFLARESLSCIHQSSNPEFFCKKKLEQQVFILSKKLTYSVSFKKTTKSIHFKGTHNGIHFSFKETLNENLLY